MLKKKKKNDFAPKLVITFGFMCPYCLLQAQFLNLLLCRCFQLSYLEKHPEEAQEDSAGSTPRRNPSLLNHGFPLSVSALVSFRRAPFRGLLPGTKVLTSNFSVYALLQHDITPTPAFTSLLPAYCYLLSHHCY